MRFLLGFVIGVLFVVAFYELKYGEGWQRKCDAAITAKAKGAQ